MKKREITNNDLEQLFNKVIERTPLISEAQVNSLLNNLPKAPSGSTFKRFLHNHLNSLISGTAVLIIVTIAILLVSSDHKNLKIAIQNYPQENKVVPIPTFPKEKTMYSGESIRTQKHEVPSTPADAKVVESINILSVSDIYKHFDKHPQLFSFMANRDTTIICKEGTSIKIKVNSFISEKTGKEISGFVQIAVKEYFKTSDIVLSNLSTTSDNKILETGGMLYIAATADNENCIIKKGREIEFGFPYSNKKDDMALFNGEWTNDKMNWRPIPFTTINSENESKLMISDNEVVQTVVQEEYVVVEQMPEFSGGQIELKKYVSENAQYPFSALKDKIKGTVYVNFVVDKSGKVNNICVTRGLDNNTLDKVAVYLVSKMPAWKPGRQRGSAISCPISVQVKFALKDSTLTDEEIRQAKELDVKIKDIKVNYRTSNYITNNKNFKNDFEQKVKKDNFQETNISEVNQYFFSASQLGWINCDRFDNNNNPKTNFSIQIEEPDKTIVRMIFHRLKAILPGSAESNRITFKNVPLGEKITIVALKTLNNKIFLAIKETEITTKDLTDLDFQPVTMDLLKQEMEKLNKLN